MRSERTIFWPVYITNTGWNIASLELQEVFADHTGMCSAGIPLIKNTAPLRMISATIPRTPVDNRATMARSPHEDAPLSGAAKVEERLPRGRFHFLEMWITLGDVAQGTSSYILIPNIHSLQVSPVEP